MKQEFGKGTDSVVEASSVGIDKGGKESVDMITMTNELDTELATFEERRADLLDSAPGKYVLIKGTEILGTFDTESDAIAAGYRELGNVPFLVKEVAPEDRPLNFVSGLVRL